MKRAVMQAKASPTSAVLVLILVVLYGCRDTADVTDPAALSVATSYRLTISGLGTGNGVVTSSPAGIQCTITAGTAATTGCSALFSGGTTVTLTAKPAAGHSFVGWGNACTGIPPCKLRMSAQRDVTAQFLKGPFTIRITSSTTGSGNGKVTSQSDLLPRINCSITNGQPAATGCSATYPANTLLTLTATAGSGFVFTGWPDPACGTGRCQFRVIQNRAIPVGFVALNPASPAVQGRWDPPFATPVVAVHVHLLLNGKVLLWGDTGDAQLWTAGTGFTPLAKTRQIYCSGHTFLPDGRLLVVGGTGPSTRGQAAATLYNPSTNSWSASASMAQGRYYPTNTTLPNGQILAISGHDANLTVVTVPEVWNGTGWRRLTGAPLAIPAPYYPDVFVAPNGKIFLAGFSQPSRYLDIGGSGQWTTVADRNVADRVMGSAVMYAPGKVLYAGGGKGPPYDAPPTATAEVINLNQSSPIWRSVQSMAFARRQLNTTILADGRVLVTGGTSGTGFNDQAGAVHTAELWDPATERWTTMATESRNRTYHSTAILLPNGRVLSTGSGEGGGISFTNSELSAQQFLPPYLFNPDGSLATRPSISSAPAVIHYGQPFTVQTPNPAAIARGNLIRLSSVTHAFNESQLLYPLSFSVTGSTSLGADAPPNGNLAPPGPYMLFLINQAGVPSVAKIVTVGP